jgi:hypothetical protein
MRTPNRETDNHLGVRSEAGRDRAAHFIRISTIPVNHHTGIGQTRMEINGSIIQSLDNGVRNQVTDLIVRSQIFHREPLQPRLVWESVSVCVFLWRTKLSAAA